MNLYKYIFIYKRMIKFDKKINIIIKKLCFHSQSWCVSKNYHFIFL